MTAPLTVAARYVVGWRGRTFVPSRARVSKRSFRILLEGCNLRHQRERVIEFVDSVQQAVLGEGIDVERMRAAPPGSVTVCDSKSTFNR